MKRMIGFIGALVIVGALATSVLAVPYDGPSVSISGAQFTFNSSTDLFTTAVEGSAFSLAAASVAGPNLVGVTFFDASGTALATTSATLEVTPINFSTGFGTGSGGGFSIFSGPTLLLSGAFGGSSLHSDPFTGAEFESSFITTFADPFLIGFNPPGLFTAGLLDIGTLSLSTSWTTKSNGVTTVNSSVSSVPEPASLLLLGSGLLGLGIFGRRKMKEINA